MHTKKWTFTLFLIIALLLTTPGFSIVSGATAPTLARVDVSIAAGETAEVVIVMKPVNLAGVSTASAVSTMQAQSATAQKAAVETVAAGGGIVENTFWINNSVLARVDAATLAALARTPGVDYIIPNFTVTAIENEQVAAATVAAAAAPVPNTWGLDFIGAPAAWGEYGVNGMGIKVAVLDTGINTGVGATPGTFTGHPDLAGKLFSMIPGTPFFPGGWMTWRANGQIGGPGDADTSPTPRPGTVPTPFDSAQHGTHVSGTIAGGAASGTRIGVAPGAQLMMGLVLPGGSGTFAQVTAGMQWAIAPYDKMGGPMGAPADVVSMSLGATGYHAAFIPAIDAIRAVGAVPVMAIGNEGPGTSGSPGNIWQSIGIGAHDNTGAVGSFSGGEVVHKSSFTGAPGGWAAPDTWIKPEFSAPGVAVMSSVPVGTGPGGSNYATWNGTSMATPHVAGALALMIQYQRAHGLGAAGGVPLDMMFNALKNSAFDPPGSPPGKDVRYGWGLINVYHAIKALAGGTMAPRIEVTPGWSNPINLPMDGNASFPLLIKNTGTAPLTFNLMEVAAPEDGSMTVLSEGVAPAGASNAKAPAAKKTASYKYTVSGASGPNILVYTDDYYLSPGNTYVEQALAALGLSYTGFYADPSGFRSALTSGGPWDLVLVSQNNYYSPADSWPDINTFVLGGGKAIIETFYMQASSSSPLWGTMGVSWVSDMPDPLNLYRWAPSDPVFHSVPDMVPTDTGYWDDGDKVNSTGTPPLAGFTTSPSSGQGGIVRSDHGIVNSFIISDFDGDDDADGKVDAVELWVNEIANVAGTSGDIPWLSESPTSGSVPPGGSITVTVSVDAAGLEIGDYRAGVVVNSNDSSSPSIPFGVHMRVSGLPQIGVLPTDPLHFVVDKGGTTGQENAFTIFNTGAGDLHVNISDQFAKGSAASAGASGGASNLPAPQGGPARSLPGNSSASASVAPSTGPDGVMFSGDKLNIGVSNYGELDWRSPTPARPGSSWMGYGFEYKPESAAKGGPTESLAVGWNGEGYVVYLDGRTIAEYPDFRTPGIVPVGADVLVDTPDLLRYRVSTRTDDSKLQVNFIITFDKHGRSVQMTTEFINIGPSFIGEIKYKRVVDWDAGGSAGDDINWHYNSDLSLLSTIDPAGPENFYAYGFGALGDSWPMIYDYDMNAWDDYNNIDHGSSWQQADVAGPFDGNVGLYFAVGALAPGERKQVNTVYTVGEGSTPEKAYADMLTNLSGGKSADVPWLTESPSAPAIPADNSQGITVSVDARGLPVGHYFAMIVINHDDPTQPPFFIPVDVVVNPPFKSIIDDPEDVRPIPPEAPAPKVDIDKVFVQFTKTTIMFNTTLYGTPPGDKPLVAITMMDTGQGIGYTGPLSNDILANYMAFGFIYPASSTAATRKAVEAADLSNYARKLPGLNVATIKAGMVKAAAPSSGPGGELFLFKWNNTSKTWDPLIQTYTIGLNPPPAPEQPYSVWQFMFLVTMVSDGSMKLVQSFGDIWDITDTAPDMGHGATVPSRDVAVTSVDAAAAEVDETPTFLTGQAVNVTATIANHGDEAEKDLPVDFQVFPILGTRDTLPGEPGYPAPALTLGDPIDLGSALIENINPGDSGTATVAWTPELVAAAASRSKAKAANGDGWVHSYLLKATVAALPREVKTTDNSAQLVTDVQVGTEVGLSDISVTDIGPERVKTKTVGDTVYTGMSYFVKATVSNNGALPIADYEVVFLIDGNPIGSQLVSLDAGASTDLYQPWSPDTIGSGLEVRAEGPVLPGEINPDDDAATMGINVAAGNDVAVNTFDFTPLTPAYGATVTFTAEVSNNGHIDLAGVVVVFDVNGTGIGMQSVDLPVGDSETLTQTWSANQVGSLMTARVSIAALPYEVNLANNAKTKLISVSGTDIGFNAGAIVVKPPTGFPAGTIKKGKLHSVQVTVANLGTTSQTFKVRLTANGTQVGIPASITAMAKGTTKLLTFTWNPTATGSVTLLAQVGYLSGTTWVPGITGDINTDNNSISKAVVVAASVRDASVTGVAVTGAPLAGRSSLVKVTTANTGNETVTYNLELYASGKLVRSQTVANITPGSTRTLNFSWVPAAAGSYTLTAKVRDGDLPDSDGVPFETTATVYVPVSLKVTSAAPTGLNKTVKIDVQLMDPTGKKAVALGGVVINITLPAGVTAASTSVTTDDSGHAVLYVSPTAGKASATVTINAAPGLATGRLTIKF